MMTLRRNRPPAHSPTPEPPPDKGRPFPLVSVIFLAVILVVGVVTLIITHVGGGDADTGSAPSASAPPTASIPVPDTGPRLGGGPCGAPSEAFTTPSTDRTGRRLDVPVDPAGYACPQRAVPTDASTAAAAPAGLTWQRVYGAAVPFSTSDGPARIVDGVPSGFARTPQGAVLAGLNAVIRQTYAQDPDTRARIVATSFAMNPDAAAAAVRQMLTTPVIPESSSWGYCVPAAVRTTTYAPDFAHVEWALPAPGGGFATDGFDMVFTGGDWKVSAPNGIDAELARSGHAETVTVLDGSWSSWQ